MSGPTADKHSQDLWYLSDVWSVEEILHRLKGQMASYLIINPPILKNDIRPFVITGELNDDMYVYNTANQQSIHSSAVYELQPLTEPAAVSGHSLLVVTSQWWIRGWSRRECYKKRQLNYTETNTQHNDLVGSYKKNYCPLQVTGTEGKAKLKLLSSLKAHKWNTTHNGLCTQ